MAQGFGDLFTYSLAIGLVLMSVVIGIFNEAQIGPGYTAPSFQYNESSVITIVGGEDNVSTGGYDQTTDIASRGFWAVLDGFKTVLIDFSGYLSRYGVPSIISVPAQMVVWMICGYEMLMLKRIIWG
jgi:hypothetical protein